MTYEEPQVVDFPAPARRELPTTIVMTVDEAAATARCNPHEMRMVQRATGRSWSEIFAEGADEADRMQTMIWLHLMRDGYPDLEWSECSKIYPDIREVDPTNAEGSTGSQPSADFGGSAPDKSMT